MKTTREVFLFGAGSVLDWGGPKTSDLTKLVRNSGPTIKNSEIKITEFIYNKLKENGYSEYDVSFETIINVIEEFIVFYSNFNTKNCTPSLNSIFFSDKHQSEFLNFANRYNKRNDEQSSNSNFYQNLLSEIITNIEACISKYAYHTSGHSVIDKQSKISLAIRKWIKEIEKKSAVRLYTLNYDRIFKILLNEEDIEVFEGFDNAEIISPGAEIKPNVSRILSDIDSNCFYNLHGSAFWRILTYENSQLTNPEIVFTGIPELLINEGHCITQIEKGKTILLSNIITGYQKAQRAFLTPYKQMQSAFDRDCCFTNKMYIIGYSFGDEHINQSLKTALKYNQNLTIEIVDPCFIQNEMEYTLSTKIFSSQHHIFINHKQIDSNILSFFNEKIKVYNMSFERYLDIKNF